MQIDRVAGCLGMNAYDVLDQELTRREHVFCCYADGYNIYASSKEAGERVLSFVTLFIS